MVSVIGKMQCCIYGNDHLKQINDIYGHGAGDELLIGAAQSIQKAYGSLGYCFRIGGDEFCADSSGNKNNPKKNFPQTGCSGRRI